jgi:hypothetical protein
VMGRFEAAVLRPGKIDQLDLARLDFSTQTAIYPIVQHAAARKQLPVSTICPLMIRTNQGAHAQCSRYKATIRVRHYETSNLPHRAG